MQFVTKAITALALSGPVDSNSVEFEYHHLRLPFACPVNFEMPQRSPDPSFKKILEVLDNNFREYEPAQELYDLSQLIGSRELGNGLRFSKEERKELLDKLSQILLSNETSYAALDECVKILEAFPSEARGLCKKAMQSENPTIQRAGVQLTIDLQSARGAGLPVDPLDEEAISLLKKLVDAPQSFGSVRQLAVSSLVQKIDDEEKLVKIVEKALDDIDPSVQTSALSARTRANTSDKLARTFLDKGLKAEDLEARMQFISWAISEYAPVNQEMESVRFDALKAVIKAEESKEIRQQILEKLELKCCKLSRRDELIAELREPNEWPIFGVGLALAAIGGAVYFNWKKIVEVFRKSQN